MKRRPEEKLRRLVKKSLKSLRRIYRKMIDGKNTNKNDWLTDNFYLLEKTGRGVLAELKSTEKTDSGENGLPKIYNAVYDAVGNGKIPEINIFAKALSSESIPLFDLEFLRLMTEAALVVTASENAENKNQVLKNAVLSLISCGDIDFELLLEKSSAAERVLRSDGVYCVTDDTAKGFIREKISRSAYKNDDDEESICRKILTDSEKNGESAVELILNVEKPKKFNNGIKFLIVEIVLPFVFSGVIAAVSRHFYLFFLLPVPLWEVTRSVILLFSGHKKPRGIIPKIKLENGIPDNAKTIITVSSLLPKAEKLTSMKIHLRELSLTNKGGNFGICLLADLKSADKKETSADNADIDAAKRMIDELNDENDGGFMLFVRPRRYSETQNEYTGFERKRGAITEFIRAIFGDETGFAAIYGDTNELKGTKYIMALDSDTGLTLDCVTELVSAAVHPSNKAKIDSKKVKVESGYGIFVPKAETDTVSGYRTAFSRIMVGVSGIGYDSKTGERYQDLFGNSIFTGKGLIDVEAYHALLDDFFKPETVLSHDILEGEILRTAFVPSSQITDGFPKSEYSYFERLSRWVRGDWQNIVFLKKKVKTNHGEIKNPLGFVSKFKLFDNLRRSLTPVAAFILIIISVFAWQDAARIMIVLSVLSITVNEIFSAVLSVINGGIKETATLYYGKAVPTAVTKILQAAVNIIILPQTAFTCGDAAMRALWRTTVSHKNMLEWVTAAQSEKSGTLGKELKKSVISVLSALWMFAFSGPLSRTIGIFFLSDILYSPLSSHEKKREKSVLSYLTREKLLEYAASMWNYFCLYQNDENNFLPPDNVQFSPVFRVAERTSPTNIGLMVVSTVAARDFSFIDSKELYERLKKSFDSIIRLKRWNGNLLNWYDTKTLEPLSPSFVSSVDSGNFLCCLVAAKQGILEYAAEYTPLFEITKRIDGIIKSTDLSVFYNEKRGLINIGYDLEKGDLTGSYYDLFMSEARLTSYFAVSSGSVPKKHWASLSRALSKTKRYSGPVSWTGTMFEYFMPYMFLPSPENTITYEALKYCVFCQRLHAKSKGVPFGISESGFYRFDANMNYQYKAHGVKALALKREPDRDLVISPYSTFICLPFVRKAALENLERIEKLGMSGECGFYEAADFTKSRSAGQDYSVVRSFMAHHTGMSIVGISNTVYDGIWQKRFMKDPEMLAGKSLLYEKIPVPSVVFKDELTRETPERPKRDGKITRTFENISPLSPEITLLSNGEWSTVISDGTAGHSVYRGINITRKSTDLLNNPQGVFAVFKTDKNVISLSSAIRRGQEQCTAEFTGNSAVFKSSLDGIALRESVGVHPTYPAEIRRFTIKNKTKTAVRGTLEIYFEPSLTTEKSENSHKTFSDIFVTGYKDSRAEIAIFKRNFRSDEPSPYCAVGFSDGTHFMSSMLRENVLKRFDGVFSLTEKGRQFESSDGSLSVCCQIQTEIEISPKSSKNLDFFLTAADGEHKIYANVSSIRAEHHDNMKNYGAPAIFGGETIVSAIGNRILPSIFFDTAKSELSKKAIAENTGSQNDLWSVDISGDNKIITVEINDIKLSERATVYISIISKLRYAGIICDLVILLGCKSQSENEKIRNTALDKIGAEPYEDFGRYIHIFDADELSGKVKTAIIAASCYVAKDGTATGKKTEQLSKEQIIPSVNLEDENGIYGNSYLISQKPKVPWCYILANNSFGTLLGDSTLGFSFALNSHANKLTVWNNDTIYDNRGELIFLRSNGVTYDVLRGASVLFGEERAEYNALCKDIKIKITVKVPSVSMKKDIAVELENVSDGENDVEIFYYLRPCMAAEKEKSMFIRTNYSDNSLELINPWNTDYPGTMRVSVSGENAFYCTSEKDFLSGNIDCKEKNPPFDKSVLIGRRLILPPKRKVPVKFILSYGMTKESAKTVAETSFPDFRFENKVIINTPDKELNDIFNLFLPNQIIGGRLNARTGFYQCGGAFGFRDQLQDALSVSLIEPEILKRQIYLCAAVQFPEGDVLHWWHPAENGNRHIRGVRTRCSDDLLWLPYAVADYTKKTGDYEILKKQIPFISGDRLMPDEHEKYIEVTRNGDTASVKEHLIRAIQKAYRLGAHSLMLIGSGDWNDGFNKIGIDGRGESVWLSQFAAMTLEKVAFMFTETGDGYIAKEYFDMAKKLKSAIDKFAWDGDRYLRAFYDDGEKLGSQNSSECKIDSLSQSFASFCGCSDKNRVREGLLTAYRELVDRENGIVKLFSPAFTGKDRRAGYVAAYPEGFRENGGQYTHAAVWFCIALFNEGLTDEGKIVLDILNPLKKYNDKKSAEKYKTEPYYFCGDVYSAKGHEGRGGWSLYTGSAGWYYTLVLNVILGISEIGGKLFIKPNLPEKWSGYSAEIIARGRKIKINVKTNNPDKMTVDGKTALFVPNDKNDHIVNLQ